MSYWPQSEIEYLRKKIEKNTVKEIYDEYVAEYGHTKTYDSIQKKVQRLRAAFSPGDAPEVEDNIEIELAKVITIPGDPTVIIDPAIKSEIKAERKQWLVNFIEDCKNFRAEEVTPTELSPEGSALVVQLSDLHIGQQNKHFDLSIAKERLTNLPTLLNAAVKEDVNEIVLMLLGDIVEGEDIFPSQPWHMICPVIDQVEVAVDLLWKMIINIQKIFDVPVRLVCVPGNHGRVSITASEKTNWDNIVYHALKLIINEHADPNISIECDYSEFRVFQVKDKRGLLNHQGVKHTGTPATREKISGWCYSKQVDFIASGHWHEWKVGSWQDKTFVANGSLCGPNDLSERMAQDTPARLGYFLVTRGQPLHSFSYIEWRNSQDKEQYDKL